VQIIHRGKYKLPSDHEKKLLKRRQAIEPMIGHTKADHQLDRCWLSGAVGGALHALSCPTGYNIRWLMRAISRLVQGGHFCALSAVLPWWLSMLLALLSVRWRRGRVVGSRTCPRADRRRCSWQRLDKFRRADLYALGRGASWQGPNI
jgi:hypothetical protein